MTLRKFTASFKAKVVLEALKERKSLSELAQQYELHPNQISKWKQEFLQGADQVAINVYVGLSPGISFNTKTKNPGLNIGITAPIGVAFSNGRDKLDTSTGKYKKKWSFSFFISMIDIGALTTYRFFDPDTESVPEITLVNIFSPGIFFVHGAKESLFSFGYGTQIGPQLQKVTKDSIKTNSGVTLSFKLFFTVDIPLLYLQTKPR